MQFSKRHYLVLLMTDLVGTELNFSVLLHTAGRFTINTSTSMSDLMCNPIWSVYGLNPWSVNSSRARGRVLLSSGLSHCLHFALFAFLHFSSIKCCLQGAHRSWKVIENKANSSIVTFMTHVYVLAFCTIIISFSVIYHCRWGWSFVQVNYCPMRC